MMHPGRLGPRRIDSTYVRDVASRIGERGAANLARMIAETARVMPALCGRVVSVTWDGERVRVRHAEG